MGATTYQEFRGIFEKDRALARRFQKIDVPEPSVADTVQILKGLKTRFEEHHQVSLHATRRWRLPPSCRPVISMIVICRTRRST